MIAIIDYGLGNLRSVQKAFAYLGYDAVITKDIGEIKAADKVVLPGVGAFKDAMQEIRKQQLDHVIYEVVEQKKPLLGICLGMQLLFEESEEAEGVKGLEVLPGKFKRFSKDIIVPHMGWNDLQFPNKTKLFKDIQEGSEVYFVHSYYLDTDEQEILAATTDYYGTFGVAVEKEQVFAAQFHPEKSGDVGLKILRNFGGL